ncbi:hypothetical protein PABG_04731 [Paracoccidioides brasiliensis Pb03]|nr:hypothetical protein PABG_04731 [Paracoccidioides brasiliensis Pb03]
MAPSFANGTCNPFYTPVSKLCTLGNYISLSQHARPHPDPYHPNFQRAFYGGANYPSLIRIKAKYDPQDVLYGGRTAVGPEKWMQREDGRLCRDVA